MTRKEELKYHLNKLNEIQERLRKAQEEFTAHNSIFNKWVQDKLGFSDDNRQVHLAEILSKWDTVNND